MKDKWLDDIRDKMAGFETGEPDGLWAEIESRMQPRPAGRRRGMIWPALRPWAVAASVAAVVVCHMIFVGGGGDVDIPVAALVSETSDNGAANERQAPASAGAVSDSNPSVADRKKSLPALIARNEPVARSEAKVPVASAVDGEAEEPTDGKGDEGPVAVDDKESEGPDSKNPERGDRRVLRLSAADDEVTTLPKKSRTSRGRGLSVGVFASGIVNSSGGGSSHRDWDGMSDATWTEPGCPSEDSPVTRSRAVNEPGVVDMRHRLPLRFGLSVSYDITSRLAVESGVVYSRHSSDVSGGDSFRSFTGEQVLHYVGIPLSLKYRLASWRSFDFYASAGVLGEKCVSGRLSSNETVNGAVMVVMTKKNESLHERQLQWSVNAAGGVQFGLVSKVGLYAEPGLSYFFDNGSAIRNIYKDRKLNFNLNLGLRFNF